MEGVCLDQAFPVIASDAIGRQTEESWPLTVIVYSVQTFIKPVLRCRGLLTEEQVSFLREVAQVPTDHHMVHKGRWVEFYSVGRKIVLDQVSFFEQLRPLSGLAAGGASLSYFLNGLLKSRILVDDLGQGDKVVIVRQMEPELVGKGFRELPLVKIYQGHPRKRGPYQHPGFIGKTLLAISQERSLAAFLDLAPDEWLVVKGDPYSGYEDGLLVEKGERLMVRGPKRKANFLFAFQASNLLGGNATHLLLPYAPLVINREISERELDRGDWPREIWKLFIGGQNRTEDTCGVSLEPLTEVKVFLR